jgi:hypothetical protein
MIRSMLVVALPVLLLVLVVARQPGGDAVRVVDPAPALAAAAAQAAFPVVAPQGLGAGWRATSARFEPVPGQRGASLWHLGLVTPLRRYAGVEQSDGDPVLLLREATAKGVPAGEETIGGATWTRYAAGRNGYRALVRWWGSSTLVVNGNAEWPELTTLAASLHVVAVPGATPAAASAAP